MDLLTRQNELSAIAALYDEEEESSTTTHINKNSFHPRFLLEMKPEVIENYKKYIYDQLLNSQGETLIEIGVSINCYNDLQGLSEQELEEAKKNHSNILTLMGCQVTPLLKRQNNNFYSTVVLIRQNVQQQKFIEVRIAVLGNVDAGKSSLLGVLTHNILDNGRGLARQYLFRHKHEFETGRTSSVGNDILGFNSCGGVVNKTNRHNARLNWVNICQDSAKVITFIDLAGHEKYLKTTIFGMTGRVPHYSMLVVSANAGVSGTTKEHLTLILSLQIPVFVIVTKIDICPINVLEETLATLNKFMRSPGIKKMPLMMSTMDHVVQAAQNFESGKICPIFRVSNLTGECLDILKSFLNLLMVKNVNNQDKIIEFQIDDIYMVQNVGTVVSGTCLSGKIEKDDLLLLGPDSFGQFQPVFIKSIHRKRLPVTSVHSDETASFALKKVDKKDVRKGMFLLGASMKPVVCYEFEAEILILHHPSTIKPNYQAMVHSGSIRQTATITSMTKEVLRTGDRDILRLSFKQRPEYLRINSKIILRDGRTKAVGTVKKIIPNTVPSIPSKFHHQLQKYVRNETRNNT